MLLVLLSVLIISGIISAEESVIEPGGVIAIVRPDTEPGTLGFCSRKCPAGSRCQRQVIYCIRAPCPQPNPPRYNCVPIPRPNNPCDRVLCPEGTYCTASGSTARCVRTGGCANSCQPGRVCPAVCITPVE